MNFFMAKLETAAKTAIPEGLGMTNLEFIIKKSDEVLSCVDVPRHGQGPLPEAWDGRA